MDKKKLSVVVALFVAALLLAACSGSEPSSTIALEINGGEIAVPYGYTFVGASAYGGYSNHVTFYCQDDAGKVYTCNDGTIGQEIVFPEGYSFAGASAHGRFSNVLTFYCRNNSTDRVFICGPTQ